MAELMSFLSPADMMGWLKLGLSIFGLLMLIRLIVWLFSTN